MAEWESAFFRSGEFGLHAAHFPGRGSWPMVVVPGITTPADAFGVAATRLADIAADVYVLDMRGRGLSQRVVPWDNLDQTVNEIRALVSKLGTGA